MASRPRYEMYAFYRIQVLVMFVVFAAVAVVLMVVVAAGGGPPIGFVVFWIAALVWNAYWFLCRIVFDLELDGVWLRWRTPLRSGAVKLTDVVELRPFRWGSNVEVFELADGTRLTVFVRKGFKAFTEALVADQPGLLVRLGFQARIADRLPGWSGFGRRDDWSIRDLPAEAGQQEVTKAA